MNVDSFRNNCPYCHTKAVEFTIEHARTSWFQVTEIDEIERNDVLAVCGFCSKAVLAYFECNNLLTIIPSSPEPPKDIPDVVARYFQQGLDNLSQNYDAAGAMFRKTLETALKQKFPDNEEKASKSLNQRIREAAKQQKLTPDLAAWAHEIRIGGNDAVHEEKPFSEQEAQELRGFTELVLLYLFTLPKMLERARNRRFFDDI